MNKSISNKTDMRASVQLSACQLNGLRQVPNKCDLGKGPVPAFWRRQSWKLKNLTKVTLQIPHQNNI